MESQRETVDKINEESSRVIDVLPIDKNPSWAMTILRLVFLPPLAFVAELTVKGALFGGLAGFKKAVNRWAFVFTTEAKRYERYFKDDNNLKKKT